MWCTFGECDRMWAVVLDSCRPQVAGRQHTQTDGRFSLNNCFLVENINEMGLNYAAGETLYELSTSWKADYWQDQFL